MILKTREELLTNLGELNGYYDQLRIFQATDVTYTQQEVQKILNAPTEEQMKCKFCYKPFIPLYSETDTASGLIEEHKVFGVYADGKKLIGLKFSFCPMCGRKLGDE
jgi:hypothetical protein